MGILSTACTLSNMQTHSYIFLVLFLVGICF